MIHYTYAPPTREFSHPSLFSYRTALTSLVKALKAKVKVTRNLEFSYGISIIRPTWKTQSITI